MTKRPRQDPTLKKVLKVSDQRLRKHSSLYDWMLEHHAELQAEFKRNGPQWEVRLKAMADAGLTDRTGKPATLRVGRNTWYAVCRAVEGRQKTRPAETPAPEPPPKMGAAAPTDEEREADPYEFKFSGPKRWTE